MSPSCIRLSRSSQEQQDRKRSPPRLPRAKHCTTPESISTSSTIESLARSTIQDGKIAVSGEEYRVLVIPSMKAIRFASLEESP